MENRLPVGGAVLRWTVKHVEEGVSFLSVCHRAGQGKAISLPPVSGPSCWGVAMGPPTDRECTSQTMRPLAVPKNVFTLKERH